MGPTPEDSSSSAKRSPWHVGGGPKLPGGHCRCSAENGAISRAGTGMAGSQRNVWVSETSWAGPWKRQENSTGNSGRLPRGEGGTAQGSRVVGTLHRLCLHLGHHTPHSPGVCSGAQAATVLGWREADGGLLGQRMQRPQGRVPRRAGIYALQPGEHLHPLVHPQQLRLLSLMQAAPLGISHWHLRGTLPGPHEKCGWRLRE